MIVHLLYAVAGGVIALAGKSLTGGAKPLYKGVYKGIVRLNKGWERVTAEIREDLEDARREVDHEEAQGAPDAPRG